MWCGNHKGFMFITKGKAILLYITHFHKLEDTISLKYSFIKY